ncbi:GNAT family N-acetyltransferase [Dyadobacter luticola]|uniref:GNAT family N-acetyltransferase n=1 Tax=Dyadobacter luticola TaxID=1979387 RepID=A0A5R9KZ10_9BACT|nr:GNAT family N-acetyltransferase [Dyadobacter luticola]TLV01330.1 GNAT family N-acetyltransferase [Dyadobacter luticola]
MHLNSIASEGNFFVISRLPGFQTDTSLHSQIECILEDSYTDPASLLARAYQNNNEIYLCHDDDGQLCGFYMVGENQIAGQKIIYLGLSGVAEGKKGLGIGKMLYRAHYEDLKKRARQTNQDITCWATTASIGVYQAMKNIYDSISPDGRYFEMEELALVNAIAAYKNFKMSTSFPFLAERAADGTNYSASEATRLATFTSGRNHNFFEEIDLDEKAGDRLLLVVRVFA